jgi:hypothetical protein
MIGHLALLNGVCVAPIQTGAVAALFRPTNSVSHLRKDGMRLYLQLA